VQQKTDYFEELVSALVAAGAQTYA
jgi:hypothetical protein